MPNTSIWTTSGLALLSCRSWLGRSESRTDPDRACNVIKFHLFEAKVSFLQFLRKRIGLTLFQGTFHPSQSLVSSLLQTVYCHTQFPTQPIQ